MKWEYKIFEIPHVYRDPTGLNTGTEDEIVITWLHARGEEGWECIWLKFTPFSYSADPEMTVKYAQRVKGYFKRPIGGE